MEDYIIPILTIIGSVAASSGFWAWVQHRGDHKSLYTQVLIGLAHDRIISLGISYIERGSITQDEYENLHDYLYEPYRKMGGNGSAKRVMDEVSKLPIKPKPPTWPEVERRKSNVAQQQSV